jgi:hypothetical protein
MPKEEEVAMLEEQERCLISDTLKITPLLTTQSILLRNTAVFQTKLVCG